MLIYLSMVMIMSKARQLFADLKKSIKVYPWTLAKLVKTSGGGTVEDYLNGTKSVAKSDTLQGYDISVGSGKNSSDPHEKIPVVGADGVIEIGAMIDMHQKGSLRDFDLRLRIKSDGIYQQLPDDSIRKIIVAGDKTPANGGNADTIAGCKISRSAVVVNAGGGNTVRIPYPSGMTRFLMACPYNSNMDANYSYIESWKSRSDCLEIRFKDANKNNVEISTLWFYQ